MTGPRRARILVLAGMLGLATALVGCGPPELTREKAAKLIAEEKLPEPVSSFSYRVGGGVQHRARRLEACATAGLLSIEGGPDAPRITLTPLGREYIGRLDRRKVDDATGYTLHFRTPITSSLIEITRIADHGPYHKEVGYRWRYDCPPILEGCTTLSDEAQVGNATFRIYQRHWKITKPPQPRRRGP